MIVCKQKGYILLLIMLIITGGCDFIDHQQTNNSELESFNAKRGLPGWLHMSHRAVIEPDYNDSLESLSEEPLEQDLDQPTILADPDINTANDHEEPVANQDQNQNLQAMDTSSVNDSLDQKSIDPSEDKNVKKAKEALQAIEEEYQSANQERKVELMNRYNQIIRGLKNEFGITYESNLGSEWWDLQKDQDPSLEHNIHYQPN